MPLQACCSIRYLIRSHSLALLLLSILFWLARGWFILLVKYQRLTPISSGTNSDSPADGIAQKNSDACDIFPDSVQSNSNHSLHAALSKIFSHSSTRSTLRLLPSRVSTTETILFHTFLSFARKLRAGSEWPLSSLIILLFTHFHHPSLVFCQTSYSSKVIIAVFASPLGTWHSLCLFERKIHPNPCS